LLDITEYTLLVWGKKQSQIYFNSFNNIFKSIATLPHLGRFLYAQNGFEYRRLVHREHLISYAIIGETVFVYAVRSHISVEVQVQEVLCFV
jgi:plasmid stabilization system protein ParE